MFPEIVFIRLSLISESTLFMTTSLWRGADSDFLPRTIKNPFDRQTRAFAKVPMGTSLQRNVFHPKSLTQRVGTLTQERT